MGIDWGQVAEKLVIGLGMGIIGLVLSAIGWVFKAVLQLRKDMNHAFHKIRHGKDAPPPKNGDREYDAPRQDCDR